MAEAAENSTAEVRISPASERAAATSALGSSVAARMQADCIRAARAWCKLGDGGLCFVLKTARDQWIKAQAASGKGEVDFYIGTSGLPLVAEGTALLPDVFRSNMAHTDSLPQVFQNQAESKGHDSGKAKHAAAPAAPAKALSAKDTDLLGAAASFIAPPRPSDGIMRPADRHPLPGGPLAPCGWMLDHIAQREPEAERSLMHRLSSQRLLVWNRNYNIKPREISTAQGRLAAALASLGASRGPPAPGGRGSAAVGVLARVALAAVGRGGAGEVGQRIRDEILSVQQRNNCKGGMMEEWHQKLHNNTSPDDVVICQALLDYIAAGLDIQAYWRTLARANITAQRLASFDRAITSEPRFSGQQAEGLQRDLSAYMQTLKAVHGGDDLRSAINNVLGYEETDMKGGAAVVAKLVANAGHRVMVQLEGADVNVSFGSSS
ncbi:Alpha-glucan water dikinase, chloroplastic [Tetrabaena socialis]|uniref:Alpha-glucan water dikinase, chloroplastic n=1 Tax=Tetrabaena socialis TaxID=47790 RepID=A0A2J8AEV4_9CHLO|nr:Alpha-glucan water dikinase, chloroplastic [Tetrabaena socialis]|eukprot:PNH11039.1 Alpha-glucan water dikinase, chloroplastic [Tetrabaena socialis]